VARPRDPFAVMAPPARCRRPRSWSFLHTGKAAARREARKTRSPLERMSQRQRDLTLCRRRPEPAARRRCGEFVVAAAKVPRGREEQIPTLLAGCCGGRRRDRGPADRPGRDGGDRRAAPLDQPTTSCMTRATPPGRTPGRVEDAPTTAGGVADAHQLDPTADGELHANDRSRRPRGRLSGVARVRSFDFACGGALRLFRTRPHQPPVAYPAQ
jgi:hypothetical protein